MLGHGPSGSGGMMGNSPMGSHGSGGMMDPAGHSGIMGRSQRTPSASPVTGVTQVVIQDSAYAPANVQVRVGTSLTWTNTYSVPHSVTFKNGMKDSGLLRQGQVFTYTFTTPGTYAYYCTAHPSMVAQVLVTPAG
jgi:plastocyanin